MIAGRIVANIYPEVYKFPQLNNFVCFLLRHLSFSRKLTSAALKELTSVVAIEYSSPRLEFDLLRYTLPLARSITWLPFPPNKLQRLALVVPFCGNNANNLPGMTGSIATLLRVFPRLKSLKLIMDWDGDFVIPGNTLAYRVRFRAMIQGGRVCRVCVDFWALIMALSRVRMDRESVNDLTWSNGLVSFSNSGNTALARLVQENLLGRAPVVSANYMGYVRHCVTIVLSRFSDDDELDRMGPLLRL